MVIIFQNIIIDGHILMTNLVVHSLLLHFVGKFTVQLLLLQN